MRLTQGKRMKSTPFIIAGAAVFLGYAAYRQLSRMFSAANPDLALRQGANLTRRARRVLAISAHQDDLEYLAGGTLRLLGLAGGRITAVVLSAGEKQRHQDSSPAAVREQEQRDAGTILGYEEVHFLGCSDLGLAHNPLLESQLGQIWEEVRPDLVLAMDPGFPVSFFVHPDHLAMGRTVLNLARKRTGEETEILFYGSRQPNVLVDISKVMEDKIQGVLAHRSQLKFRPWAYGSMIRFYGRMVRANAGISYGESFRILTMPRLREEAYREDWPEESREPAGDPALV